MFTTSGTYPWSFVTQIFHNGQPSHGGDRKLFEVINSTLPKGTLGSVASLLAATLYQGNPDRNHKLWNIVSTERYLYILHISYELKIFNRKSKSIPEFSIIKIQLNMPIHSFLFAVVLPSLTNG